MEKNTNTYIVSARKYRPQTFDSIVGQEHVTNTLKNAILNNQIAQAYLFFGPRGVGKTTCARVFAKTINCTNLQPNGEACNECPSCKAFNSNTSFNIYELDAASNNSVEDIRQLIDQVRYPPQSGKYKVYIIDEVHMLSTAAFNAFLKTLEEPPSYAKFILATTEKNKVLPTILSRCQVFNFNRIKTEDIARYLERIAAKENHKYEHDAIYIIAQKADGGLRDACSIYDQIAAFTQGNITTSAVRENLHVLDYDYYFQLTEAFLSQDYTKILSLLDNILSKGFDPQNILVGLMDHLRYLLLAKNYQTLAILDLSNSAIQAISEQTKKCSEKFLLNALSILNKADVSFKSARHQRLHLEIHFLQIANLNQTIAEAEKKNSILEEDTSVAQSNSESNIKKTIKVADKPVFKEVTVKTTASIKEVQQIISSQKEIQSNTLTTQIQQSANIIEKEIIETKKVIEIPTSNDEASNIPENIVKEPQTNYSVSSEKIQEEITEKNTTPTNTINTNPIPQNIAEKRYEALLAKNPLLEELRIKLNLEFK
ncbi:MAG TPA: DNA polymerase III subunit gamma/tau [Bacteroidia bacterium]|nr:DNA polymerase III subunit gamma/tau [Bacteroidia bacterium]